MVNCPTCRVKLPVGASRCQYCHATFAPLVSAQPVEYVEESDTPPRATSHDNLARHVFHGVAAIWLLSGLVSAARPLIVSDGGSLGMLNIFLGLMTAAIGAGLVFELDGVRGIVTFLCWTNILFGLIDIVVGAALSGLVERIGMLFVFFAGVRIVTAGMMLYVIHLARTRPPNA